MNGFEAAQQKAQRAQARRKRQIYFDYSFKGLRPRYPPRKSKRISDAKSEFYVEGLPSRTNSERRVLPSLLYLHERRRTDQSPNGYIGTRKEKFATRATKKIELAP